MIVLITPVVEVDGRDRMVDIYRWHKAHPNEQWPHLSTGATMSPTTTTATPWA